MATMWQRTLAWLGLVEEYDEDFPQPDLDAEEAPPTAAQEQRANVRRLEPAHRPEPAGGEREGPALQAVSGGAVHLTGPTTFNDVEEIGGRFRDGVPVIIDLSGASETVAKRVLDFASGLTYGLEGRIEKVGQRVFLLSPRGVQVSSEQRARLRERGFFNQA